MQLTESKSLLLKQLKTDQETSPIHMPASYQGVTRWDWDVKAGNLGQHLWSRTENNHEGKQLTGWDKDNHLTNTLVGRDW